MIKYCVVLFVLLSIDSAQAHSYQQKAIQIGHAWSMPTDSSEGRAFFPLLNTSVTGDRLIAMSSPVAKSVAYVDRFGTVQPGLILPSKMPIALRKGGAHLRLIGLTRPLKHGDKIPLALTFEKAGRITVELWIEPAPYAKPHKE